MKKFIDIVKSKENYNTAFDKHLELLQNAFDDLDKKGSFKFRTMCFDDEIQIDFLNDIRDGLCINAKKIMYINKDYIERDIKTFKINQESINELVKMLSI